MQDRPYFMNNKKWYYFDFKNKKYVCKKDAPQKAKKSLKEFYKVERLVTGGH